MAHIAIAVTGTARLSHETKQPLVRSSLRSDVMCTQRSCTAAGPGGAPRARARPRAKGGGDTRSRLLRPHAMSMGWFRLDEFICC